MPEIAIVADDLTGAADCAVASMSTGLSASVILNIDSIRTGTDIVALDLASRGLEAAQAAILTGEAIRQLRNSRIVYKKIDSRLRGHIGAEIAAARQALSPGAILIMAPAFPAQARKTVSGVQFADGIAVGDATAILTAAGLNTSLLGLDEDPRKALTSRVGRYDAFVCDAITEEDLRSIVIAGLELDARVLWAGSAGLARWLPIAADLGSSPGDEIKLSPIRKSILFIVGSASPQALLQANVLQADLRGDSLALVESPGPCNSEDPQLCRSLAASLAPRISEFGALVMTGGETARAMMDACGITGLRIIAEIEPGVPLSMSIGDIEIPVVTKSGAFSDAECLVRVRDAFGRAG